MIKRIGFKFKLYEYDANGNVVINKKYLYGDFRLSALLKSAFDNLIARLANRIKINISVTKHILEKIATLDPGQRIVCIESTVLPLYNEECLQWFWKLPEITNFIEVELYKLGEFARNNDIRVVLYADYYTSIISTNEKILKKSIKDVEKQATIARLMGYGQKFHDCDIIVPLHGSLPIKQFKSIYNDFTPELKNCITISNKEFTNGLDECLELNDICPVTIDIFNHLNAEFDYISPDDERIKQVISGWKGVRPIFGYSSFNETVLAGFDPNELPAIDKLTNLGIHKKSLHTHGDFLWNTAMNDWALTHLEWADCMVHMKSGFLASTELYNYSKLKSADSF